MFHKDYSRGSCNHQESLTCTQAKSTCKKEIILPVRRTGERIFLQLRNLPWLCSCTRIHSINPHSNRNSDRCSLGKRILASLGKTVLIPLSFKFRILFGQHMTILNIITSLTVSKCANKYWKRKLQNTNTYHPHSFMQIFSSS